MSSPPNFLPVLILPHLSKDPSPKWLTTRPLMPHLDLCQAPGAIRISILSEYPLSTIIGRYGAINRSVFKDVNLQENLPITVINHKYLLSKNLPKKRQVFNMLLFFSNVAGVFCCTTPCILKQFQVTYRIQIRFMTLFRLV